MPGARALRWVQTTVWTSAVAGRFETSRGLGTAALVGLFSIVGRLGVRLTRVDGTDPVSQTIAAALFGGLVAALSLGTAFGPLAAGLSFDRFGGYSEFLVLTMVLMAISSAELASLRPAPGWLQSPSGGTQVLRPADIDDAGVEL